MSLGNVVILGDSYSTFEGYVPSGYAIYYFKNEGATDVRDVTETWWYRLIKETDSKLILNDSWSGSTVCHTGYNNSDVSKTSSFVCRVNKYITDGFFDKNKVDTLFIFGGTNDSWADSPIGEIKFDNWQTEELYSYLPAAAYLISTLKEFLPDTRIIWIINSDLKDAVFEGTIKICEHYGIQHIELKDIDKHCGHPTVKGMEQIKNTVLENLA